MSVLLDSNADSDVLRTDLRRLLATPDVSMGHERKDAVCSSPLGFCFEVRCRYDRKPVDDGS